MPNIPGVIASGKISFEPTIINWNHLWWAEGPDMKALAYTNNASVNSWPDEKGSADLSQATSANRPTYKSAESALNSRPAVSPDGSDDWMSGSVLSSISQPLSIVAIGVARDIWNSYAIIDQLFPGPGLYAPGDNHVAIMGSEAALLVGSVYSGEPACLIVGYFNGTNSQIEFNGTVTTGDAGAGGLIVDTIYLFQRAQGDQRMSRPWALVGIKSGDVRTDAQWSNFEAWVTSYYGITIA